MGTSTQFILRYGRPYLHWYAAGALALAATNWLTVTIPIYLAEGIDILEGGGPTQEVTGIALTVALMGCLIIVIRSGSRLLFFTPGRLVEAQVKHDVFATLLRQQKEFLSKWPPADIISRASNDIHHMRLLAGFGIMQMFNTLLAVTLVGMQMYNISPHLTVRLVPAILVGLIITQICIRFMFRLVKTMQEQLSALSDHALSSYQGLATIQGFVAEQHFSERFEQQNREYLTTTLKRANIRTLISPVLGLAASFNVFLLLYLGGQIAVEMPDELSIGDLVAMTALIATAIPPLRSMSFLLALLKEAHSSIERVFEVMLPAPDRPDLPDPLPAPTAPPFIEIKGLSFCYPNSTEKALDDINLSIAPGTTGIFGRTGSGKSTLLSLLSRLYNPPEGTLFVDGVDIRAIDLDAWRQSMTLIPQVPFLFSESLQDNILLSSTDTDKLSQSLTDAALIPDLAALAEGPNTQVGEEGLSLSGGQRQRVAIARALMRSPVVTLLDDVLSAVDHETEHQLIKSFKDRGGSTVVIVSHRISALRHADKIAVFDGGRLVDIGTHEELLSREGFYKEAAAAQTDTPNAEAGH